MIVGMSTRSPGRIALGVLTPLVALATIAGTVSLAGVAYAADPTQTLRFAPSDDAYTSSARATYNTGTVARLMAGRLGTDTLQSFIKVTVGTLPAGSTVRSATLTLTRDEHHLPPAVSIAPVAAAAWTEQNLTARTAPAAGAVLDTEHPATAAATVTFDVSAAVKRPGTYAFAVTSPAVGDAARFRSTEYSTGRPVLTVTVTTPPAAPAPASRCTLGAKLVPTCGILWGAAAGGFTDSPRDVAERAWEQKSGRTATVFHLYHTGDQLFPTAAELAMARDMTTPRVLFENWKVSWGTTWAASAAGANDKRIDAEAAYLRAHFTERFFLTVHHEPENDVNPATTSGMTAKDFAAMFRHTVLRMRADGVTNAVFVMSYMSYERWFNAPWWNDLYPGDDVTDWIALDAYLMAKPGFHSGPFRDLMDRTTSTTFPGFYQWTTTRHPKVPFMLGEWGVYEDTADLSLKPKILDTVRPDLARYPALKAMFYFDAPSTQAGYDCRIDSSPASLAAFRRIATDPRFNVSVN